MKLIRLDIPILHDILISEYFCCRCQNLSDAYDRSQAAARFNQSASSFQSEYSFIDSPTAPAFSGLNVPQRNLGPSQSTPAFLHREEMDNNPQQFNRADDLNRIRAMRVAQARAHVPPSAYPLTPPSNPHVPKRFNGPAHARSLPSLESGRYQPVDNRSVPPISAEFVHRDLMRTGLDHYGAGHAVALPASGGVFPRLQDAPGSMGEAARMSPANPNRLKGLFKNRDSRVYK
jgi:hypothetical protein